MSAPRTVGGVDIQLRTPHDAPREPDFGHTAQTPMLKLPAVALATLRYSLSEPFEHWVPQQRGPVTTASIQLGAWRHHRAEHTHAWRTAHNSAWKVARDLQGLYHGGLRGAQRVPLLGLDLIRCTDELGMVAWWCDVASQDDEYRFQTVRLSEALARCVYSPKNALRTPANDESAPAARAR
ncbi:MULTISPECIES: hypothetical protein [unclassified Microbacterium]|uniref:hypothetical protein n=1 Tax=unclassified Microbacterium TaxID=2609290 RepID=UPI00301A18DE